MSEFKSNNVRNIIFSISKNTIPPIFYFQGILFPKSFGMLWVSKINRRYSK